MNNENVNYISMRIFVVDTFAVLNNFLVIIAIDIIISIIVNMHDKYDH